MVWTAYNTVTLQYTATLVALLPKHLNIFSCLVQHWTSCTARYVQCCGERGSERERERGGGN